MHEKARIIINGPIKIRLKIENVSEWAVWINDRVISSVNNFQNKSSIQEIPIQAYDDNFALKIICSSSDHGSFSVNIVDRNEKSFYKINEYAFDQAVVYKEQFEVVRKFGNNSNNSRTTKSGQLLRSLVRRNDESDNFGFIKRFEGENYIVPVFYATDRNKVIINEKLTFGTGRAKTSFGVCNVNIPKKRKLGSLNKASWWKLQFEDNPDKHVFLMDIIEEEPEKFFDLLVDYVNSREKNNILVFIHGFHVRFEAAVLRAAQISFDTGFTGTTIVYSWPSAADINRYSGDEENVLYSHTKLINFLKDLHDTNPDSKIFLMAHSMGSRAVVNALVELQTSEYYKEFVFNQVILAAPDIDSELLVIDGPRMNKSFNQMTLYASSKDKALALSRGKHNKIYRAGESSERLIYLQKVDTVDASYIDTDLLGHSYIGSTEPLIMDLHQILNLQLAAKDRNLLKKENEGKVYWQFRNN